MAIVCLLQTRSVPKTTSGKIARSWCKRGLLEGSLQILHRSEKKIIENDVTLPEFQSINGDEKSNRNGYQAVETKDDMPTRIVIPGDSESIIPQSAEDIRNLSKAEIQDKLEKLLIQISSVGPTQLKAPLEKRLPLISMGLDSMTVVQFKGVIENRYLQRYYFEVILIRHFIWY